ncbi:MAG: hypothetical protein WEB85_17155, partial [Dongiaceae bacterium]
MQELLNHLSTRGHDGEIVVANLITAVCKTDFSNAGPKAQAAAEILRQQQRADSRERDEAERRRREERERAEGEQARVRERQLGAKQAARDKLREAFLAMIAQSDA